MAQTLHCLIDLHLHLDGSLSAETARALAAMQGIELPRDAAELDRMLHCPAGCRDLNEYLACFTLPLSLLQTGDALREAARRLLTELADKGFLYAELRFAPQSHGQKGMSQEQAIQAVLAGMQEAPIPSRLILCAMRGADNEAANRETVQLAARYLGRGVAALDLAGAEAIFPTGHALALHTEEGLDVLIHIGLDTVKLDGKYFHVKASVGQTVKQGDVLIEFDREAIEREGFDVTAPILICNSVEFASIRGNVGDKVSELDQLITARER